MPNIVDNNGGSDAEEPLQGVASNRGTIAADNETNISRSWIGSVWTRISRHMEIFCIVAGACLIGFVVTAVHLCSFKKIC